MFEWNNSTSTNLIKGFQIKLKDRDASIKSLDMF